MGITAMNRQEAAETVALQVLSWLAGNDELFPVFLGATGASGSDMATDECEGKREHSVSSTIDSRLESLKDSFSEEGECPKEG